MRRGAYRFWARGPAALAGHGRDLEISRARASLPGKWRLPVKSGLVR